MPFVEDNRIAQRDGTVVIDAFVQQVEHGAAAGADPREPIEQSVPQT